MLIVVQARMTSRRLPGKVLMELAGRPTLWWTISRLRAAEEASRLVVATSDHATDDPIVDFCGREGVACHRGPLDQVADRFAAVARAAEADAFVRICGDSPLIDPAIVDQAIALYRDHDCDLVTNVLTRTFPVGQSVEVLRAEPFYRACATMTDDEREHVTRCYYAAPERFHVVGFTSGMEAGAVRQAVDTAEDFTAIERLIAAAGGKPGGWNELLSQQGSLVP